MKWIGQHIWDFISRFRSKVYLEDVANAGSDTDAFLVKKADGEVAIRTGAEVLSDIGASSESSDLEFNGNTANGVLTYGGAAQIDVESSLIYNGSTGLLSQSVTPAATFQSIYSIAIPDSGWASGSQDGMGVIIDFDNNHSVASGQTNTYKGLTVGIDDDGAHVGTVDYTGVDIAIDFANTDGTQKVKGIETTITDCDTADTYGLWQRIEDGANDLRFVSSANPNDYFNIATKEDGETTLTTVEDGGGSTAHLNLVADGDIVLNSASGVIKTGSTTFVNNSGVIQVATQGTIDHDSLANFVAAEHYRWDTDIASTATIHTENITDLHGAGVDGADNSLLTDNGDGSVTSEFSLTWDGDDLNVTSGNTGKPSINLVATQDSNKPAVLKFVKDKGAEGDNGDYVLQIDGYGDNAAQQQIPFCQILGQIGSAVDSDESGTLILKAATSNGSSSNMREGFKLTGHATGSRIDVELGYGDDCSVVIAGKSKLQREYGYPTTNDGDHSSGDVMYYDSGTATTVAGKIYYFNGSGSWTIANADAVVDSTGMLAVALGTNPDVDGMLLRGFVTLYDINGTEDHGAKVYLHTTDGLASTSAPGTGNVVRVIGYNLHNTNDSVYFNPDNSWVEVS